MDNVDYTKYVLWIQFLYFSGWVSYMSKIFYFQEEILREASAEALQMGLLIGTEDPNPQEEEAEMLCFPHSLLQEFVTAHYIATLTKVHTTVQYTMKRNGNRQRNNTSEKEP